MWVLDRDFVIVSYWIFCFGLTRESIPSYVLAIRKTILYSACLVEYDHRYSLYVFMVLLDIIIKIVIIYKDTVDFYLT